jgi:hypothetical protein
MANDNWSRSNSFRPQYGPNHNSWSSRRSRGTNSSNRRWNPDEYDGDHQQQENFTYNTSVNQLESYGDSTSQVAINDDEKTHYAINLQLKPVEMGITAKNSSWNREFNGLGAFNHYFGLCAPTNGLGYTLADIWDGYFHITLAKFITQFTPDELEMIFSEFKPSLKDLPRISDIEFRATRLETHPGTTRPKKMRGIPFVVLPVDTDPTVDDFYKTKLQLLLTEIKEKTKYTKWNITPLAGLHVTIRKYSTFTHALSKIKIQDFPITFRCSHLEVKQTRDQAISRFNNASKDTYQWWTGVTEVNKKCSGCKTLIQSGQWEGFCLACGKYESIIPIWSTNGKDIRHYRQILNDELRETTTITTLVHNINLNEH